MTDLVPNLILTLIYAGLGILIFIVAFLLLDWITPSSLWKEIIEDENTALGVLIGGVSIALSIIIAASIF